MSFTGKNALVTGSSRGIGRGIALKLAEKGARVAVHYYRNQDAALLTLERSATSGRTDFWFRPTFASRMRLSGSSSRSGPNSARSIFSSAMRERRRRLSTKPHWRSRWINGTPQLIRKLRHF